LTYHLERNQVQQLFDKYSYRILGESFKLPLTFGFGSEIAFDGRWYEPRDSDWFLSIGVRTEKGSNGSQLTYGQVLPITPYWLKTGHVKRTVHTWVEQVIDSKLETWIDCVFAEHGKTLPSELLRVVCHYYSQYWGSHSNVSSARGTRPSPIDVLKKALKLLVLEVVMGHQICIPDYAMQSLLRDIPDCIKQSIPSDLAYRYDSPSELSSPRVVNRVVKSILYPIMKILTKEVIDDLDNLWRTRGNGSWTESVCIMVVLLTASAGVEVSLADWDKVVKARNNGTDTSAMHPQLQEIEAGFCQYFIEVFHARFKTSNPKDPFNPFISCPKLESLDAASARFVNDVSSVLLQHCKHLISSAASQS
jgi:hypothetical protein